MKKTVLITGASGEIGSTIALEFAKLGFNIIYHYNNNKNDSIINAISKISNILPIKADLTKKSDIEALINSSISTFGKIDVLINNAGISSYNLAIDEKYESISSCISTNLISAIYLTSLAIPHLNKNASIVNISSIWGEIGGSGESTYSASKAGLIGYTKALAKELGPSGIRVNAVAPGLIDTKMNNHINNEDKESFIQNNTIIQKIGTTQDVANAVMFLASDNAQYITGEVLSVNGGIA